MGTFSALLALCAGNSPVADEFPSQRPMTRRFDVFFDLRLNKRLSKRSWGWWFETPSRLLWPHCNEHVHNFWKALPFTIFFVWPASNTRFCQFHYVINSTCQNSATSGNPWINQSQLSHHGVNNDIQTIRQTWTMQQMPWCRSFDRLATTTLLVPTKTYIEIFIQDFFSYEI